MTTFDDRERTFEIPLAVAGEEGSDESPAARFGEGRNGTGLRVTGDRTGHRVGEPPVDSSHPVKRA